ncbi:MAG: flagellar hook-basal body complex protein FliE, partial [Proteobacteria bacterium]|nr:flagellar hook-basal body complex protein FliE [Pseudomonadota bacterium]
MSGIGGVGPGGGIQQIMALRQQILERSQLLQQLHAPASGTAGPAVPDATPGGGFAGALKDA